MKRQPLRKVNGYLLSFLIVGCLFLCSCGIEQFYHLEAPEIEKESVGDDADNVNHYCKFKTNDDDISLETSIECHGTTVYYRIYDSIDTMKSHVEKIKERNTSDSNGGYTIMTSTYQYCSMQPVIPFDKYEKTVSIRLSTEGNYTADVSYTYKDGTGTTQNVDLGAPSRDGGTTTRFMFTEDYIPTTNDIDYTHTSSVKSPVTVWYVPLFAVSAGKTPDDPSIHSKLCYLGYFTIQQGN